MTALTEREVVQVDVPVSERPCHAIDSAGRPLCGTHLIGYRAPHSLAECESARHPKCATCESLRDLAERAL